ncbi:hypothetical protein OG762_04815 [Streptomyces sp. NBC_01136]|uniref:hypothetical protein n=1 Tax=unclassified Streptomyces TaxID=2593676 RepID=UPI00325340F7|nr:hypothetical protein OG762_04815 [Streptomyces sp. NBC_01136]
MTPPVAKPSNEVIRAALEAHGGLDRWLKVAYITANVAFDGVAWDAKTREHPLTRARVTVETGEQRTILTPFLGAGRRSSYSPDLAAVVLADGRVEKARAQPRAAFATDTDDTAWDELKLAYFTGFAFWNYLNLPFLIAWPGFVVEDVTPFPSSTGTWQRVGYSFPEGIATHNRLQAMYFDERSILQRLDYNSEIFGGQATAHLLSGYETVSGIPFPTRREIVPRNQDHTSAEEPVLIGMTFTDIEVVDAEA